MFSHNHFLKRAIPVVVQSATAHRKPRWLPVAKSKIFRIPKRPVISEEERVELLRINNNYKTQMRAIRRYYFEEMTKEKESVASTTSEMGMKHEAEEWERCVALNEQWNTARATEREERRKVEHALMEERALAKMQAKDEYLRQKIERATEEIRKQKELSATFITPDTLDSAIDQALANPIDYNFAIDLKGNKVEGRETPFVLKKDEGTEGANA